MRNEKKSKINIFKQAVEATPDVANCYQAGLRALGTNSNKVQLADTSKCCGSIDIDGCTTKLYPSDNRWDYGFCYASEVYFVEVHTASTSEVSTVLRKLQWIKDWLNQNAPEINKIRVKSRTPYYWIQSNGFHIRSNTSQYRQVVQAGLKPIALLILN